MQNFESIRPYRDDEVAGVVGRLVRDPNLQRAAAAFYAPRFTRAMPWLARRLAQHYFKRRTAGLDSVQDVQRWLSSYMARVIRESIQELSVDGLEDLPPGQPYLFISNHRDIVMDSALLNYLLHEAGHQTARMPVGDNLFSEPYAADLMRLNKSFVIERNAKGSRAMYQAVIRTSSYIRHSLEEGESVWIAQREGRAKDGFDRTDPALLKMLSLAYRKELSGFAGLVERMRVVPVSVSYELDPCDCRKAHELFVAESEGRYVKRPGEDLASMVDGIVGFKGRVHLHVGRPVSGEFADPEALADHLDRIIVAGMRVFPTQAKAAQQLGYADADSALASLPRVMQVFDQRLQSCPAEERPYLLRGYGNLIRNRQALGIG